MEIFFKKMVDRVTSPRDQKYNTEFENETTDTAYNWRVGSEGLRPYTG